jgi:hypothetical protein
MEGVGVHILLLHLDGMEFFHDWDLSDSDFKIANLELSLILIVL